MTTQTTFTRTALDKFLEACSSNWHIETMPLFALREGRIVEVYYHEFVLGPDRILAAAGTFTFKAPEPIDALVVETPYGCYEWYLAVIAGDTVTLTPSAGGNQPHPCTTPRSWQ